MGWWEEGAGEMIGDDPLDLLDDAFKHVAEMYSAEWKRKPTKAEWENLVASALRRYLADTDEADLDVKISLRPG